MSEHVSAHLLLPYMMPSQAQKHVTHNEALRMLDGLVQLSVIARDRTEPPAVAEEGDRYIVGPGAGGAWSGWDGDLAVFAGGNWLRHPVRTGWRAWIERDGGMAYYDGAIWTTTAAPVSELQNLERLGVGTGADAGNPFAAKLNAALWTALTEAEGGTGDLRYTMNKESAADTVSLLFQSGWSGRAELGLVGSDALTLKVSGTGDEWVEALKVATGTGEATLRRLLLDQQQGTRPLRIGNSGGSGVAGLEMQVGSNDLYAFEVGDTHPPVLDKAGQGWFAYFEDGMDMELSRAESVVTRDRGDARYLRPYIEKQVHVEQMDTNAGLTLRCSADGAAARMEFHRPGTDNVRFDLRDGGDGFTLRNVSGDQILAKFEQATSSISATETVVTRRKGDARYQQTSSSRRFKENEVVNAPRPIAGLRAKTWSWGGELDPTDPRRGTTGYGLVAEDVAAVLPEAVRYDAEERVEGLDSLALIGALVEELRLTRERVTALEERVAALEAL